MEKHACGNASVGTQQIEGVEWMECNAVEWIGMDAFWVILGLHLVVFCQKRKKVNFFRAAGISAQRT